LGNKNRLHQMFCEPLDFCQEAWVKNNQLDFTKNN